MTGGEPPFRKVENARLNTTLARMREAGYSVEVTVLVDRAVRARHMAERTEAMADLLDLLGLVMDRPTHTRSK